MTSSVIYYSTDARKNEIYLLIKTLAIRALLAIIRSAAPRVLISDNALMLVF